MIKLVILDLDNTLYDETAYFKGVLMQFERALQLPLGSVYNSIDHISRSESKDILKDCLQQASVYSLTNHDLLFNLYKTAQVSLKTYSGVDAYLSQLKIHNCYIAILTNGVVDVQKNKVSNLDIESKIDKVFYARENNEGYEKPEKQCFINVVDYFGCELSETIMIGDSYNNDYQGAINIGIQALWLNDTESDISISRLSSSLKYILGNKHEKN